MATSNEDDSGTNGGGAGDVPPMPVTPMAVANNLLRMPEEKQQSTTSATHGAIAGDVALAALIPKANSPAS